jgi:hypothetical protein
MRSRARARATEIDATQPRTWDGALVELHASPADLRRMSAGLGRRGTPPTPPLSPVDVVDRGIRRIVEPSLPPVLLGMVDALSEGAVLDDADEAVAVHFDDLAPDDVGIGDQSVDEAREPLGTHVPERADPAGRLRRPPDDRKDVTPRGGVSRFLLLPGRVEMRGRVVGHGPLRETSEETRQETKRASTTTSSLGV